jgi:hypothetical protein
MQTTYQRRWFDKRGRIESGHGGRKKPVLEFPCTAFNGRIEAGIKPAPATSNPIRLSRHPSVCMRMGFIRVLALGIPKRLAKDQPGCTPPGILQPFPNTMKNHYGIIARFS